MRPFDASDLAAELAQAEPLAHRWSQTHAELLVSMSSGPVRVSSVTEPARSRAVAEIQSAGLSSFSIGRDTWYLTAWGEQVAWGIGGDGSDGDGLDAYRRDVAWLIRWESYDDDPSAAIPESAVSAMWSAGWAPSKMSMVWAMAGGLAGVAERFVSINRWREIDENWSMQRAWEWLERARQSGPARVLSASRRSGAQWSRLGLLRMLSSVRDAGMVRP